MTRAMRKLTGTIVLMGGGFFEVSNNRATVLADSVGAEAGATA